MSLTVDKCLQAWTNSLRQMNAKADIVFFGDSLTYYGDFTSVFPGKVVCNLGLRGDTIKGMIKRVNQIKFLSPKKVYLMAGLNDVAVYSPTEFGVQYESLILCLKAELPKGKLVIQSLLPVNCVDFRISCKTRQIKDCNELISLIASRYNLDYLDLFSAYEIEDRLPRELTYDGIHLKPASYDKWRCLLSED